MSTSSHSLDASFPTVATAVESLHPAVTPDVFAEVARLGLGEQFPEVIALTREMFGDFTIDISEHPEIADCFNVAFEVELRGSPEDSARQTSEWHRRLPRCPTQTPAGFCLLP